MKQIIIGYGLLLSATVQANVYQCEVQGRVTFSQFPCQEKAALVQEVSPNNVLLTPQSKLTQQITALRKKSRFIEYQLAQFKQQQKQQLEQYKNDIYLAQRRGEKSAYLTMMNQRYLKMQQDFASALQQREQQFTSVQQQLLTLEKQHSNQQTAQQSTLESVRPGQTQ